MTQNQIYIALGVVVLVAIILLASRRSGPRVTTIETRHDKRDETIETRRERDDTVDGA